jgi:hypothetical protein
MQVTCEHCNGVVEFVPSLTELQREMEEMILDRIAKLNELSGTDEAAIHAINDYLSLLVSCVVDAAHNAAHVTMDDAENLRKAAKLRFGKAENENG